jgi:hypothetical protein
MDRIRAEYLQKILEQVNHQNVEYFENLACEYSVQYQLLASAATSQDQKEPGDQDGLQPSEDLQLSSQVPQMGLQQHEGADELAPLAE